jgi:uncharacterized protein (TIGR03000 family)
MYTVVVLAALGTSVDLPDCGRHRRHGCCGGGCYGYSGSCSGCWGGCYGSYGSCHGSWGSCSGCWGGGYSGYAAGSYQYGQPVMSGYYDPRSGTLPTWSDVDKNTVRPITPGDRKGEGVYTDEPAKQPDRVSPGASGGTTTPRDPNRPTGTPPMPKQQSAADAPATIIVDLPANARLTVDGQITQSTSSRRTFVSPPLKQGVTYQYSLEAKLDGNVTTIRAIDVRAGQVSRITMDTPVRVSRR